MIKPASDAPTEPFDFPAEFLEMLTFVLNKVTERVDRRVEAVIAPLELTFRQYGLLVFLQLAGPRAQVEISQQTGVDRTSVMREVDGLERRGLVRRDPDPNDRRRHSVVLTDAGEVLLARSLSEVKRVEREELYAPLSEQAQAQLLSLLRRLLPHGNGT